jgi:hypothetical protein
MAQSINKVLAAAVIRILRPLVRILLRYEVPYGAFADLARWVYMDVADREFRVHNRKQTVSRIAVITGLTRKEVARLQKIQSPDDEAIAHEYNRAVRVINGWITDSRFVDQDGAPKALAHEGEDSFALLVKHYSGDVTPGAVLDELTRVGVVEIDGEGRVKLLQRAYVPGSGDEEKLHILGSDVALLLQSIDHNIVHRDRPWFQRKVAYDNLPEEALAAFRDMSRAESQALLESFSQYLAQHDRDVHPEIQGTGRKRAGVGIYYFEEEIDEESSQ